MNGKIVSCEKVGKTREILRDEKIINVDNIKKISKDSNDGKREKIEADAAVRFEQVKRRRTRVKYRAITLNVLRNIDSRLEIIQEALTIEVNGIRERDSINRQDFQNFFKILNDVQNEIDEIRVQVQQLLVFFKEKINSASEFNNNNKGANGKEENKSTNYDSNDHEGDDNDDYDDDDDDDDDGEDDEEDEDISFLLFSKTIARPLSQINNIHLKNDDSSKDKHVATRMKRNVCNNHIDLPKKKLKVEEKNTNNNYIDSSKNLKETLTKEFNVLGVDRLEKIRNTLERTLIDQTEQEFQKKLKEAYLFKTEICHNSLVKQRLERLRNITHLMTQLMDLMEYIVQSAITILTIPNED